MIALCATLCIAEAKEEPPIQIAILPTNIDFENGKITFKLISKDKRDVFINIENLKNFGYRFSGIDTHDATGSLGRRFYNESDKTYFILSGNKTDSDLREISRLFSSDFKLLTESTWHESIAQLTFIITGYYDGEMRKAFFHEVPVYVKFTKSDAPPAWKILDKNQYDEEISKRSKILKSK